MGSPLGPVLANIFMCHFEEKWLTKSRFCPSLWFRYVDDTFTMFDSKDNAYEFLSFLNSRKDGIKFTIEFEDNKIPFLDILLKRCPDNTFSSSVHRTKTFTGLYTKWDFIHTSQVQNQPHPHSHLSMFPNLLLTIFITDRY